MNRRTFFFLPLALLLACGHSEPFNVNVPAVAPLEPIADMQLTYNDEQDYWPTWTEDGQAILYAYVEPADLHHRCIGLIAPQGGTRLWSMCHTAATYFDSTSSFSGFALGGDGRLLYTEAVGVVLPDIPIASQVAPRSNTLWLADSSAPFRRTLLLSLPLQVDGSFVTWLSEIKWTGPDTFMALGQAGNVLVHCPATPLSSAPICEFSDTVFAGAELSDAGIVVRGTIAAGHATLAAVPGTVGATGYSFAENGATIVFTMKENRNLYRVPVSGGAPTVASPAISPFRSGYQLLGVACHLSACIVATDSVLFYRSAPPRRNPELRGGSRELWSISLSSGAAVLIAEYSSVISSMAASPAGGDVVLQVGGNWGHLQTYAGSGPSNLHFLRGIVK